MAIAIPLRDMMLEVMPNSFIRINEIRIEAGNGSVRSQGGEAVPQGYAEAVAEYFRKLSKSK